MCLSHYKVGILFSLLIAVFLIPPANAEETIHINTLHDKIHGMWLAQLIGNMAGRETEGDYSSTPNPASSVPWVIRVPNPSDLNDPNFWDADDDTDIEYVDLHILETNSLDCNSQQITDQWLTHVSLSGIYIANKQAWYLMTDGFTPPETGSRTYNEHWYSIDSQITTETLGAICPGMPQRAIELAQRFALVTNEGFPVHAAQFYTAIYANAFFEPNVVTLVTEGLNAIPTTSRTHEVITDVLNWYTEDANDGNLDWRQTREKLYDYYQGAYAYGRYYYWIESTVNTGATVLAILYGQGDFKQTVQIGVLAGWDCDCNPATAAGLIGIIDGFSGLPDANELDPNAPDANYSDIYKNVYRPYVPNPNLYRPQYDSITNIAQRLANLAVENILDPNNYLDLNDYGYTDAIDPNLYHIPQPCPITPALEKPDPNGPAGLVAEAINLGINVTTKAAVEYHIGTNDRRNLDAIIDGITDNSYNGHRPYYSYLSDPGARPLLDWYQLDFSQLVKFNKLTFYEGDIVWKNGNIYHIDNNTRGGFFENLTLQVLRDGVFAEPANLEMTPTLDRYKMYQNITFDFAPTIGNAIRIIGTPGGGDNFTTIMELEVEGTADPGLYVSSVEIGDGPIQRSNIFDIAITFSEDVNNITFDDIVLAGTTHGTTFNANQIGLTYDKPSYCLTLEFDIDQDSYFEDSLPDDTYQLKLSCDTITDADGRTLLDDDQDPEDGFYTIEFHRLFGDANASASIDFADFSLLALHWLDVGGDTGLDSNADNIIDYSDLKAFVENWLLSF